MTVSKQERYDQLYMDIAVRVGQMSHDEKYTVGSVIVKDGNIISMGWNGMPSGMENETRCHTGCTKPEVLHSEANALMKLIKTGGVAADATMYCSLSPCMDCAKLIYQAGIRRVVFADSYNTASGDAGKLFLHGRGIIVECVKPSSGLSSIKADPEGKA